MMDIERRDDRSPLRVGERLGLATLAGTALWCMWTLSVTFIGPGLSGAISAATGGVTTPGPPNAPTLSVVVFPATEDSARLTGTSFVGSGSDTHDSTQFNVDEDGGDWSTLVFESSLGAVTTDTATGLTATTAYQSRMRYKGASGGWSDWSSTVDFTTTVGAAVDTLFFDDFETGDRSSNQNNAGWFEDTGTRGVVGGSKINGTYSLGFRWPSGGSYAPQSEQKFALDRTGTQGGLTQGYDTVWISYITRYENYSHSSGTSGTRKFIAVWGDDNYNNNTNNYFISMFTALGDSTSPPWESSFDNQIYTSGGYDTRQDLVGGYNAGGDGCRGSTTCAANDQVFLDTASVQQDTVCFTFKVVGGSFDNVNIFVRNGDTVQITDTSSIKYPINTLYLNGEFNNMSSGVTDTIWNWIDDFMVAYGDSGGAAPPGCAP